MKRVPVPVTVVAGASGAATDRFVTALAQRLAHTRAAVITTRRPQGLEGNRVVAVDEEVVERRPGCVCCAVRHDLVSVIRALAQGVSPPGRVIVQASPGADIATIAQTFLGDPDLRRRVMLDAVVAVDDGPGASVRLATEEAPPLQPVHEATLALADRLVLADAQLLNRDGLDSVVRDLAERNPFAPLLLPDVQPVRAEDVCGVRAYDPSEVPARLAGLRLAATAGGDGPRPYLLEVAGELDPRGLERWRSALVSTYAPRLLRLHGAFAVRGEPDPWVLLGVRSQFQSGSGTGPAGRPGAPPTSRVLVVGDFAPADLHAGLAAFVT